ncbi:hypothetical protein M9H77_25976 [Catharanthus roseus]|uniref:Uncharacterized protein n=1 Tax=Catharanthus roseus TaxID=4058 RepID=A0ACC0AB15_CATRO|nr:hypothetical protein M9H77_25976 [Catharanthus roseus]
MSNGEITIFYDVFLILLCISIFILAILLFIFCKKKPIKIEENPPSAKLSASFHSLMDIDSATDGFKNSRIIGKGWLGTVYAAVMPSIRGRELVAIKRIHPHLVLTNAGFGFSSTIKWLSLADHPHIVQILGYSEAPGERIIVMEFQGMLSLEFYLYQNPDGAALLDWGRRVKIAAGIARGIEYLHELMTPHIVHGRIKPSNILIDAKFRAKLCDYGLNFLAPMERQGQGLMGYVDNEYWIDKKGASKESDLYGLGVVLLELLSGRRNGEDEEKGLSSIVEWALPLIKNMKFSELLDHRLVIPSDIEPLVRLGKVALACVGNSRKNRPSIAQVVPILNNLEKDIYSSSS